MTIQEFEKYKQRPGDIAIFYGKRFAVAERREFEKSFLLGELDKPYEWVAVANCESVTIIPDPTPTVDEILATIERYLESRKILSVYSMVCKDKHHYSLVDLAKIFRAVGTKLSRHKEFEDLLALAKRLGDWSKSVDNLTESFSKLDDAMLEAEPGGIPQTIR